jgi:outer membrane receptor protein involved in Fe transport
LPRFKAGLATTWAYRDYALTGRINHIAGWRNGDSENECFSTNAAYLASYRCRIRSWTTPDLLLRYTGVNNLELGFAVRNIGDKAAPLDPQNTSLGYNSTFHNPYGRNFSVWLNYKFM